MVRGYAEHTGCRRQYILSYFGEDLPEPCGYCDNSILGTSAGQFVLVRGYNGGNNPQSIDYAAWNPTHRFYGVGGLIAPFVGIKLIDMLLTFLKLA